MSRALQMKFLVSASAVEQLPATRAEIVFVGRSNVGKSSLLNAIAGREKLARVSKAPGRTKQLDCFALEQSHCTLVDCPGYGYAHVAKSTRAAWTPMIERYLLERERLAMALLLVDGEIGPTASDLAMLGWLRAHSVPHTVVATKHDKVKSSHRDRRMREVAQSCAIADADIVWVSAAKGTGIPRLRELVRLWLS